MTEAQTGVCYGAIPFRAFRDYKLSSLQLRLLGIVAAHDRFGRNGQGCWASVARLAQLANCTRGAVHTALAGLTDDGEKSPYITMHELSGNKRDGRRRTYEFRVVYSNEDFEQFEARDTGTPAKRNRRRVPSVADEDVSLPQNTSETGRSSQTSVLIEKNAIVGSANKFPEGIKDIGEPRSAGFNKLNLEGAIERLRKLGGFDEPC